MILSDSSSPMPGSHISSPFEAFLTLIFGLPGDFIAVFGRFFGSVFFILPTVLINSGYSVVRLPRLLWEQEVGSSNLSTPTLLSLVSQEEMRLFAF